MAQQAVDDPPVAASPSGIVERAAADLEGVPRAAYGDDYNVHLLEQYKLYVQMADKVSDRRQLANTFAMTINTALVTVLAVLIAQRPAWLPLSVYVLVCGAGIILCFSWHRLISSYRDLNTGKFKVIHEIEKYLPVRPYDAEWTMLGQGKVKELYLPFTHVETRIPWMFAVLYGALSIVLLVFCR